MTPLHPQTPRTGGSGFVNGLSIGVGIGLVVMVLIGAGGFAYVKRTASNVRKGWNLVPVVTAAVDIKEDTVLTMAMITQRDVPEQFVTSSVMKPDYASKVVNQRILVPVQAGDPLLWSQFETKKQSLVLFAKRDLPSGTTLFEAGVEERPVPQSVITPSWVRTEDRPQALGKKLLAPFRKGDPILWTHFEVTP